jgi:2-methylaconitate cis-trans-isomerase PrpF
VFVRADSVGLVGTELADRVNADGALLTLLEEIRGCAAELYGFVADRAEALSQSPNLPKIALVAAPLDYTASTGQQVTAADIDVLGRGLAAQRLHQAFAVTGAICVGAAARVPGTIVSEVCSPAVDPLTVRIGHPAGIFGLEVRVEERDHRLVLSRAALERTARRIMDGYVYVPPTKVAARAVAVSAR